jgi:hypothetical protein
VGLGLFGYDKILETRYGQVMSALQASSGADAAAVATATAAAQGAPPAGMGAIVFSQLSGGGGMGAIVPEYGGMNGLGSPYGEAVSLRGVNPSVFGSSPF